MYVNVCLVSVQNATVTSRRGMLLSSLEDATNFIIPPALGILNPGHGITNRPLILYGRGKEADALVEAQPSTLSVMMNRPAACNGRLVHQLHLISYLKAHTRTVFQNYKTASRL